MELFIIRYNLSIRRLETMGALNSYFIIVRSHRLIYRFPSSNELINSPSDVGPNNILARL